MAGLLALARSYGAFPGDEWALRHFQGLHHSWLDESAIFLAGLFWGHASLVIAPPVVLAVSQFMRGRRSDALLLLATPLAPAINLGLKELATRPRPDAALALVEETGYAFPSGHAVFAAVFFGAAIYLLEATGRQPAFANISHSLRRALQFALILLILAVGASRVYLGVHWPSDVFGGFLFGGLCLWVLIAVHRKFQHRLGG